MTIRDTTMSFPTYPERAALRALAPHFGRAHKEYMRTAVRRIGAIRATILKPMVKGRISVINGSIDYPIRPPAMLKECTGRRKS